MKIEPTPKITVTAVTIRSWRRRASSSAFSASVPTFERSNESTTGSVASTKKFCAAGTAPVRMAATESATARWALATFPIWASMRAATAGSWDRRIS